MDVEEKDASVIKDAGVNEEKTTNIDDDLNEVGNSSRSLSFCGRMRGLPPHSLSLKDPLKNKTVPYMDIFWPSPPPSRKDDDTSRRMIKWK